MLPSFTLALLTLLPAADPAVVEADVVIRGGTIHDGSSGQAVKGDLAIRGDRIVAVGKFAVKGTPRVLDCGRPGRRARLHRLAHPQRQSLAAKPRRGPTPTILFQGVTTVVTGNCGFGPRAMSPAYFQDLDKNGVGTNVIHQVPHNAVRQQVMGNANRRRPPTS